MDLKITLPEIANTGKINELKDQINQAEINGIISVKVNEIPPPVKQGGSKAFAEYISLVIKGDVHRLTQLATVLTRFAKQFNTEVAITLKNGIIISVKEDEQYSAASIAQVIEYKKKLKNDDDDNANTTGPKKR